MRLAIAMSVIGLTCMAQTTTPKKLPNSTSKPASAVQPRPGVISGRVFAITAGGDIKPARLARVYLLDGVDILKAWYDQLHISRDEYLTELKDPEGLTKGKLDAENDGNWDAIRTSVLDAAAPKEKPRLSAFAVADIDAQLELLKEMSNIKRALVENAAKAHFERYSWTDDLMCRRELLNYDTALLAVRNWRWEHREWDQFLSAQADEEGLFKIVVPHSGKYLLIARGRAGFNEAFWSTDVATGAEAVVPKLGQPEKACLVMQ